MPNEQVDPARYDAACFPATEQGELGTLELP